MLVFREMLIAKQQEPVLGKGVLPGLEIGIRQGLRQIEPPDFGAKIGIERDNVDAHGYSA